MYLILKGLIRRIRLKKCPKCPDGRLEVKNWIRATRIEEKGQRYPESWTCHLCDICQARFRTFLSGKREELNEEEWELHCSWR